MMDWLAAPPPWTVFKRMNLHWFSHVDLRQLFHARPPQAGINSTDFTAGTSHQGITSTRRVQYVQNNEAKLASVFRLFVKQIQSFPFLVLRLSGWNAAAQTPMLPTGNWPGHPGRTHSHTHTAKLPSLPGHHPLPLPLPPTALFDLLLSTSLPPRCHPTICLSIWTTSFPLDSSSGLSESLQWYSLLSSYWLRLEFMITKTATDVTQGVNQSWSIGDSSTWLCYYTVVVGLLYKPAFSSLELKH